MFKSDEEIVNLAEAGRIADAALEAALRRLRAGVEETVVAAAAVERMHALGAREAFPTAVVGGVRAGMKHGEPRRQKLTEGEMVFIDLGANLDGYNSDLSRCTVVGVARGAARALLEVGLELYHAGLKVLGPGRTVDEVSQALLQVVRSTEYERHYCPGGFGHGIGTSILEGPGLYAGNRAVLRPRMAIAYEPMVVVEGLGTGVVEDTILITESGYERLTQSPVLTWQT